MNKSKLQEYFQKKGMDIPSYSSEWVDGPPHQPIWISNVLLPNGKEYQGDQRSSRRLAESSAAEKALKKLRAFSAEPPVLNVCLDNSINVSNKHLPQKKIAVLVDIENVHSVIPEIVNILDTSNIKIYGFISTHHSLVDKIDQTPAYQDNRVDLIKVPCTRPDGADIGMVMITSTLIEKGKHDIYFIITKDHFGHALADCIRGYHKMVKILGKKKAYCVPSVNSFMHKVEKYL